MKKNLDFWKKNLDFLEKKSGFLVPRGQKNEGPSRGSNPSCPQLRRRRGAAPGQKTKPSQGIEPWLRATARLAAPVDGSTIAVLHKDEKERWRNCAALSHTYKVFSCSRHDALSEVCSIVAHLQSFFVLAGRRIVRGVLFVLHTQDFFFADSCAS